MDPSHLCLLLVVFLISAADGFLPEEMECPEVRDNNNLFFATRPVPLGTTNRAMLTLPPVFDAKISDIPGRGIGVHSKSFIAKYTWLAEYEGEYVPLELADDRETYDFAWRVRRDGDDDRLIDAVDESLANWLRYINCGRRVDEENVEMAMCYGRVFFITNKDLVPGQELLMYCGDDYVETYLDTTRGTYYNKT